MNVLYFIFFAALLVFAVVVVILFYMRRGPAGAQGPQGDKGPPGSGDAVGEQGPPGPQGPQGVTGSTGIVGNKGPAGVFSPSTSNIRATLPVILTLGSGTYSLNNILTANIPAQHLIIKNGDNLTLTLYYSSAFTPGYTFIVTNDSKNKIYLEPDNTYPYSDGAWNNPAYPSSGTNYPMRNTINANTSVEFLVTQDSNLKYYLTMMSGANSSSWKKSY